MLPSALRNAVGAAALVAAAGWTVPVLAQDEAATEQAAEDRVVAEVNGEEIRQSEVMEAIRNLPAQVRQMPPQMLVPLVADQLVTGRLIAGQAYEEGIQDSEAVQERLAEAERRIVQEVWLNRKLEEQVTDEKIEQAYQDYLKENPPAEEVHARHILVETEDEAREIIAQLEEGADFAQLANEHSTDPGSAQGGGDLGYFTKDQMVEPFAEAAFALEPGEITQEPVESQFGWHVIKSEDKRMSEPATLDEVRGQLEQELQRQVVQDIVADLRADAEITLYGPDGEPLPPEGEAPATEEGAGEAPAEGEGEAAPQ